MTDASWENFEAEVENDSAKKNLNWCKVARYVMSLSSEGQDAVKSALNNSKVGHVPLHRGLISKGFDGGVEVIRRHRDKSCCCYRGV